jgi:primosomal protein N'
VQLPRTVARVAVSAATYWLDKPYDYLLPPELAEKALPGMRVYVPFSRGNRRTEGVILLTAEHSSYEQALKPVLALLDEEPVLSEDQIKLALFMRERFFCTVYDAIRAMLPAGLWFDEEGRRRAKDKSMEMARLAIEPEEAETLREFARVSKVIKPEEADMAQVGERRAKENMLRRLGDAAEQKYLDKHPQEKQQRIEEEQEKLKQIAAMS